MSKSRFDQIDSVLKGLKNDISQGGLKVGNVPDPDAIPKGDMPGDKVLIGEVHIKKAALIYPKLLEQLIPTLEQHPNHRAVVAVCGGSGVGKSETASLLAYHLNAAGIGTYILSGDNYPHRIPMYNDAERLRTFRQGGVRGLVAHGQYTDERFSVLKKLQENDQDADPAQAAVHPWITLYRNAGKEALQNYLGTPNEINFAELSSIISQFKNGADQIYLKRMGRQDTEFWFNAIDFSDKSVIIIEWTHGNNHNLQGVDIPVLLNSTPQETLEHRRSRNRDGKTDSPFTTLVLEIEQGMLVSQSPKAKLIVSKTGEIIPYSEYLQIMK